MNTRAVTRLSVPGRTTWVALFCCAVLLPACERHAESTNVQRAPEPLAHASAFQPQKEVRSVQARRTQRGGLLVKLADSKHELRADVDALGRSGFSCKQGQRDERGAHAEASSSQ